MVQCKGDFLVDIKQCLLINTNQSITYITLKTKILLLCSLAYLTPPSDHMYQTLTQLSPSYAYNTSTEVSQVLETKPLTQGRGLVLSTYETPRTCIVCIAIGERLVSSTYETPCTCTASSRWHSLSDLACLLQTKPAALSPPLHLLSTHTWNSPSAPGCRLSCSWPISSQT